MERKPATDYEIRPDLASLLYGVATMPFEERVLALGAIGHKYGARELLELFAQFIGLANSVAENAKEHAQDLLIVMGGVHPHTAEKINMPCVLGALNGLHLVEGIDTATVCHGCAFRKGAIANQCWSTTMEAEQCTTPGEANFMCHEDMDELGKPTKGCRGFAQRRSANNAVQREAEHG